MEAATLPLVSAGSGRKQKWDESEEDGLEKKMKMKRDGNLLLASYLAHEYLTHGTLFGQKWASGTHFQADDGDQIQQVSRKQHVYKEVAIMLKTDDVHIPQIVNPSQLASWLHLSQ